MKKIIKKGVNRFEMRRVTCIRCFAKLEFTPDEWICEDVKGFLNKNKRYYIVCPCCGVEIDSYHAECVNVDEELPNRDSSWEVPGDE